LSFIESPSLLLKNSTPFVDCFWGGLPLAIDYMTKKWSMPIPNWNAAMAHFLIKFEDRI
jgi:putative transposase